MNGNKEHKRSVFDGVDWCAKCRASTIHDVDGEGAKWVICNRCGHRHRNILTLKTKNPSIRTVLGHR